VANAGKLSRPFRFDRRRSFRMKDVDPGDTGGLSCEKEASKALQKGVDRLRKMQEKLYAQDRWALLLVFQAIDAAGKDGTIKHVMSGVNPSGCQVFSFKAPSAEELDHDFLWRTTRCLPERGRIGIFNRSWYEEVLVVRVHPEILERQKLPADLITKDIWNQRHEDIRAFERYLSRNGVAVVKFFLAVSKEEQKERFLARLDEPEKHWKFELRDVREREHWDRYMKAYEDAIRETAAPWAPWYVIPADHKWFTRLAVADAVVDALETLDLEYPQIGAAKKTELAEARRLLEEES